MKAVTLIVAGSALLLGALSAGPAVAATAQVAAVAHPASSPVTVVPSTGLAGGDTVTVTASGITPSASVAVIQCNVYLDDPTQDCPPVTTTTASASGKVSVTITLSDPVYRVQPAGDDIPVYCRADDCHVFLAWTDSSSEPRSLSSAKLFFKGSPATITPSKTTGLHGRQLITVTGTAFGARGHHVEVLEEACYAIVQGSGCYGQLPEVTAVVGKTGHYSVRYRVKSHLADGTDCTDPNILGQCELSVIVLTKGKPDNSFGLSSIGQPAAFISFIQPSG